MYDKTRKAYLASFRKPVKGLDVAVTQWTEDQAHAMAFKVYGAARSAVDWLGNMDLIVVDRKSTGGKQ